jgi:hypothetical protein
MKINTGKTKSLIIEAIKNMPNDFALSEARTYLNWSLREVEKVEKKRNRRMQNIIHEGEPGVIYARQTKEASLIKQSMANENKQMTQEQLNNALNLIDSLINAEKQKIEIIKSKSVVTDTTDINDELDKFKDSTDLLNG